MLAELFTHSVFADVERKVGNEDSLAGGAERITIGLLAVLTRRGCVFGLGEIDVDAAAINLDFVHLCLSFDAISGIGEFDVAESVVM